MAIILWALDRHDRKIIPLEPPGPVGNLVSVSTTSGSVTISWDRPSSLGGRTDYYYSIEHSDPRGSASSTITANSRLEDANSRVTYTVTNLLPFETYNIRVIAHNGVSDQENSTAGSRTRAVDATTSEAGKGRLFYMHFYVKIDLTPHVPFLSSSRACGSDQLVLCCNLASTSQT